MGNLAGLILKNTYNEKIPIDFVDYSEKPALRTATEDNPHFDNTVDHGTDLNRVDNALDLNIIADILGNRAILTILV